LHEFKFKFAVTGQESVESSLMVLFMRSGNRVSNSVVAPARPGTGPGGSPGSPSAAEAPGHGVQWASLARSLQRPAVASY
jgi:hypothetical protein